MPSPPNTHAKDSTPSDLNIRFNPALYSSGRDNAPIDMLVMHYTAGPTTEHCIEVFRNSVRRVSCHYIVGLDGEIVQMVYDQDCAWHCGVSSWHGRGRCNPRALGIEIVNWGRLEKKGDVFFCWPEEYATPYEGPEPVFGDSDWWAPYPDSQITRVIALSRRLMRTHGIPLENVVGHSDIAPGRKIDPGSAFPWKIVREQLADLQNM